MDIAVGRRQLKLSDMIDLETQDFKQNVAPIFYNNNRIIWPPRWNGMDEFTFRLQNGQSVDRMLHEDTREIGDEDHIFNDMYIKENLPSRKDYIAAGGKSKRRKMRYKNTKRRKTRKTKKMRKH